MGTTQATDTKKLTIPCPTCGRLNRINASRAGDGPRCGACGTSLALDHPVHLTDTTFDRVIGGTDVPVLVDFYADWCGPCKMVAPVMDELARTRMGSVLVAKVDTERNPRVSQRFGIASIPTVMVFKDGRQVAKQVGALPRQGYEQLLDQT
ncbi:MAG TPA: thioredoxin TrxC [Longimicrobium sp.]